MPDFYWPHPSEKSVRLKSYCLSIAVTLLFIHPLFSQLHDNVWLTGIHGQFSTPGISDNSIIIFDSIPPTVIFQEDYHYLTMRQCGTAISDKDGSLLFSTNCHEIANADNVQMENGDSLNFNYYVGPQYYGSGSFIFQGAISIPDPINDQLFHLLHVSGDISGDAIVGSHLLHTKIDMSLDNGKGAVTEKNIIILEDTTLPGGLTATRHANGRDWWLVVFKYGEPLYYKILLTPEGVFNLGVEPIGEGMVVNTEGTVLFSPDGSKLVVISTDYDAADQQWLYLFDFDRCTGVLSGMQKIYYSSRVTVPYCTTGYYSGHAYGCNFSPNSRYLYLAGRRGVSQADLWASDIKSSLKVVANFDGFRDEDGPGHAYEGWTTFGWSQLGPDGRIYGSTLYPSLYFHVTEQPNNNGLECKFEQHSFKIKGLNHYTVPNHPNYRLGPLEGSDCDTLGIEKAIFVHAHPYPDIGCIGGEAHFEVTAFGMGKTYQWQVSKDNGSNWENLLEDIHFIGVGTEYLTVKNIQPSFDSWQFRCIVVGNLSAETSHPAMLSVIGQVPTAAFDVELDKDSLHVFNNSQYQEYSQWYFGDGSTSTLPDASHFYLATGSYEVSLVATNACGADTSFQEVEIEPIFADLVADKTLGCAPLEVTFTSLSPYRVCPHRFYLDGAWVNYQSGRLRTATVTYSTPGVYDVEYRVFGPGGEADTIIIKDYITVLSGTNPISDIEVQQDGATVQFTSLFALGESYTWILSTGDTLIGQTIEYTFSAPGIYRVQLQTQNHCGLSNTEIDIVVGGVDASFTMSEYQGCNPLTIQFTNTTGLAGATYQWHFPGGQPATSTEENPLVVYENPGIYEVQLIAQAGGLSDTMSLDNAVEVLANPCPQPNIFVQANGLEVTVWTDCTSGTGYMWLMGDGSSFSTQAITYQYGGDGAYNITLLVEGPCGVDTASIGVEVMGPNATIANQHKKYVSLVPNPTSGQVTAISENGFPNGATLRVFNSLGIEVLEIKKIAWKPQESIQLDGLPSGAYFFRFESVEGQMQVGKLVVK